jgi:hypothetical protein
MGKRLKGPPQSHDGDDSPSSNLHPQVPTACGLTALAYCSCCSSFVGLRLSILLIYVEENAERAGKSFRK